MDRGVGKGDRVAIYLPNEYCLRWIVAYAAVHKAGAVMVPANTRLSVPELVAILGHAEVSAMFTCAGLLDIARAVARAGSVARVDPRVPTDLRPTRSGWDDEVARARPERGAGRRSTPTTWPTSCTRRARPDCPKGVLVRHRNVAMIPNGVPHWTGAGWLHGAPLFTFAGMSFIYNPMKMGLTGVYMPKFDVDHWFDVVEHDQPDDDLHGARDGRARHRERALRDRRPLGADRRVDRIGAPRARDVEALQDRMPQASVSNSYGLTEAGPAYIVMPKEDLARKPGSVGKPMPPMEVKVVDPDTDDAQRRPTKSASCSCACPGKRREYYKDDGANASTWTDDGWLRTGDLAYLDDEGFVYISGRIKDMIIRGGNNIYATDVEAVLLEHPDVQEAAVIGVPHTVLGEDVGAFVVLREARRRATTPRRCTRSARERLADYKRPRRLWFVDRAPAQRDRQGHEAQAAGAGWPIAPVPYMARPPETVRVCREPCHMNDGPVRHLCDTTRSCRSPRTDRPSASDIGMRGCRDLGNDVKLDAIHERVVVDRPRVGRALTERFAILLTRTTHVRCGHAGERNHLDRVDLDACRARGVLTADLDLRATPESERQRDASRGHPVAELGTELHRPNATPTAAACDEFCAAGRSYRTTASAHDASTGGSTRTDTRGGAQWARSSPT